MLGVGEFPDEMSFFDDEPRSVRVVAHEDATLLEIRNQALKPHLNKRPAVARKFL